MNTSITLRRWTTDDSEHGKPRGMLDVLTSLNHKDQGTQKDPPASTDCQGGREQKMVDHKRPEGTHEQ